MHEFSLPTGFREILSQAGKRNNKLVVQEDYVFKADQYHITKVSDEDQL